MNDWLFAKRPRHQPQQGRSEAQGDVGRNFVAVLTIASSPASPPRPSLVDSVSSIRSKRALRKRHSHPGHRVEGSAYLVVTSQKKHVL